MPQLEHLPTASARPAWLRFRCAAEEELCKPECHALLPDTWRPGHQQDLGEPISSRGLRQATTRFQMADEWCKGHVK
jgi:hypothetical protein